MGMTVQAVIVYKRNEDKMIGVGDLRRGLTVELDGEPYQVVEYQQHKMQQRAPVLKMKMRHLKSGRLIERSFQAYNLKLQAADVEHRTAKYIYNDDDLYYFMDSDTYDQFPLSREQLGDVLNYLTDQTEVALLFYNGDPINVDLPTTVDLKIEETPPGVKGDTAQGGTKPATLETGLVTLVPLFVNQGETIRVDTRTGEYVARAG
jgi:elongation factor P